MRAGSALRWLAACWRHADGWSLWFWHLVRIGRQHGASNARSPDDWCGAHAAAGTAALDQLAGLEVVGVAQVTRLKPSWRTNLSQFAA